MENKKKSSAGLPARKKSVLEDKNGEDFAILSSRFKRKKKEPKQAKVMVKRMIKLKWKISLKRKHWRR